MKAVGITTCTFLLTDHIPYRTSKTLQTMRQEVAMTAQTIGDTTVFKSGQTLKVILTISFALLLLFIANAIIGALWLASHKLWTDAGIFMILFGVGIFLLIANAVFLFAASHVEIRMGPEKCVMTLPNWRGPTPLFPYVQLEIPYKDVAAVETRNEIYRYFALPVVVHASSFVRRDGKRFTLGYMRESSEDHAVPYREIAGELARRAGVEVSHKGFVDGGMRIRAIAADVPCWETSTLDENAIANLSRRETALMKIAATAFMVFVLGGLAFQVYRLIAGA